MIDHITVNGPELLSLIRRGEVVFGGNKKCRIYGKLSCGSGKRMNISHRVFFRSEAEAIRSGYRPCGHCMFKAYKTWKYSNGTK